MATFNDNLFAASQVLRLSRSSLTRSLIIGMELVENDMLVSSAYMLPCECFSDKGRSFMYKMKRSGPR